ncbi:hypothetical protein GZH47_15290 [Paenibacillus rhizovicinus]|uniref:Uncharacterized protein n=1 Tax=Paenibacillus rhizovicinus TaxID=2704463 RepID=A0A6C0P0Q0_9BACL|nr:hypothetical protein [Paenibacillus rhizovicinus]QHW32039.1 hypothetical protein GZH47_15290 [Paenibacillus rhizovicinus]
MDTNDQLHPEDQQHDGRERSLEGEALQESGEANGRGGQVTEDGSEDETRGRSGRGHRHGEHGGHGKHGGRGGHRGRDGHHSAAQTFRRGRALAFLEELRIKRDVLRAQMNDPDMGIIKEVVSGELKAVDEIITRFMHTFELHETNES